ncbi:DUF417 family protein [Arachidicoccus sp.]|uniref:DUF417 family protein n=1 Tax=Arachidicoccus sp. TaxID=1872624 RepID=UPI003D1ECB04
MAKTIVIFEQDQDVKDIMEYVLKDSGYEVAITNSNVSDINISKCKPDLVPLVSNSPLISWTFKVFGIYHGSDLIGLTEQMAALLIIIGQFKPQTGIVGASIATAMFFITSTLLISTPSTLTINHIGSFNYLSLLGLFLFKDIISLGASINLVGKFGEKANSAFQNRK